MFNDKSFSQFTTGINKLVNNKFKIISPTLIKNNMNTPEQNQNAKNEDVLKLLKNLNKVCRNVLKQRRTLKKLRKASSDDEFEISCSKVTPFLIQDKDLILELINEFKNVYEADDHFTNSVINAVFPKNKIK